MPVVLAGFASLTLGLAPFHPRPHLVEKLELLVSRELTAPIDIADLFLHALPWAVFIALGARFIRARLAQRV